MRSSPCSLQVQVYIILDNVNSANCNYQVLNFDVLVVVDLVVVVPTVIVLVEVVILVVVLVLIIVVIVL